MILILIILFILCIVFFIYTNITKDKNNTIQGGKRKRKKKKKKKKKKKRKKKKGKGSGNGSNASLPNVDTTEEAEKQREKQRLKDQQEQGLKNQQNLSILKNYNEVQYVSKNKKLIEIFEDLKIQKNKKEYNLIEDFYNYIKYNKWEEVNNYIHKNSGELNFFKILKQLFLYYYFLPKEKQINRKQFQNALGIQQINWMIDLENKQYINKPNVVFYLWENIPIDNRNIIYNQLANSDNTGFKYKITKNFNIDYFNGTIWYKIDNITRAASWGGYGDDNTFYPIPETINLSNIACIYAPVLIFGILSDQTLLKYIIKHKQRPYAAHLPNSKNNLISVHSMDHLIVNNWRHDFHHSKSGNCNLDAYNYMNKYCRNIKNKISKDNIIDQIDNLESDFNKCINDTFKENDTFMGIKISRAMNDTGANWDSIFPIIL